MPAIDGVVLPMARDQLYSRIIFIQSVITIDWIILVAFAFLLLQIGAIESWKNNQKIVKLDTRRILRNTRRYVPDCGLLLLISKSRFNREIIFVLTFLVTFLAFSGLYTGFYITSIPYRLYHADYQILLIAIYFNGALLSLAALVQGVADVLITRSCDPQQNLKG